MDTNYIQYILPNELIFMIAEYLDVLDFLKYRYLCRKTLHATETRYIAQKHLFDEAFLDKLIQKEVWLTLNPDGDFISKEDLRENFLRVYKYNISALYIWVLLMLGVRDKLVQYSPNWKSRREKLSYIKGRITYPLTSDRDDFWWNLKVFPKITIRAKKILPYSELDVKNELETPRNRKRVLNFCNKFGERKFMGQELSDVMPPQKKRRFKVPIFKQNKPETQEITFNPRKRKFETQEATINQDSVDAQLIIGPPQKKRKLN